MDFPEFSQKYNVSSVPMTMINNDIKRTFIGELPSMK